MLFLFLLFEVGFVVFSNAYSVLTVCLLSFSGFIVLVKEIASVIVSAIDYSYFCRVVQNCCLYWCQSYGVV